MSSPHRHQALIGLTLAAAALSAGCGGILGGSHVRSTKADERLVIATPASLEGGRNKSQQVVCAEPSPDVATALSKATNLSGGLDVAAHVPNAPVEGSLGAAAALSLARAQTVAQLTNRLATIQLLRDALYRACEAYGNGALSEITYAIMLSRYDKLMVTLLSGELVAGNFGQSLAVLGTAAGGSAGASASKTAQDASKAADSVKSVDDARKDVVTKQGELDAANAALAKCGATDQACKDSKQADVTTKHNALTQSNDALGTAVMNARGAVAAFAESHASTVIAQGVGALQGAGVHQASAEIVNALTTVQRKYIENINADPIIVACLTAFDRDELRANEAAVSNRPLLSSKQLVTYCRDALPQIVRLQADLLRARLVDGQNTLLHSCVAALDAVASADAAVKAAGSKLVDFCGTNFMTILKTQREIVAAQKALEDAQAESQTQKLKEAATTGAATDPTKSK